MRVKAITLRILPDLTSSARSAGLSCAGTGQAAWVTPVAGAGLRSMAMVTGLRSISRESATIGGGIVAEKNRVCRSRRD